jgi:hypothetical protein
MTSIIAGSKDAPRYPSVSVGVHKARCVKIIDLGTQKSDFNGEISWKRQVLIIFETPEELNSEGQPLTISKFYTLSLHEKSNLGNDLTSWRGRAFSEAEKQSFDISKLLGVPCLLNVMDKNGKPRISSIMPMKKGDPIAEQITQGVVFSLEDFQNGKKEVFNNLSEGIRNIILRSKELEGINQDQGDEGNGASVGDSPIPF